MTNTFKKSLALLLGIVLTLSLCSVAFAATIAQTDAATLAALGISGGNSVNIVDSPDGSGEKAILYNATNTRPNVELANDWVEGTTYTIAFKYWMAAEHTGGSFQFYYGQGPSVTGKTVSTQVIVDNSHIGDGQWHTKFVKFTYNVPTSNTANTKVYLTFFNTKQFKIYLKDIVISPETFANCYGDFDILKADDTTVSYAENYTNGSNGLINNSKVGNDGNIVFSPSAAGNCTTISDTFKGSIQYIKLRNVVGSNSYKISLIPGNDYAVVVNYKVDSIGSNGKGGFGIGYLVSGGKGYVGNGWNEVQMVDSISYTETTEDYNTYYCSFTYTGTEQADFVIAIPYVGQKIALGKTTVVRKTTGAKLISTVTYNDNGEYLASAEYIGEPLSYKGSNGYLGEECKGWSTSPLLTGDNVTAVPAADTTLYAKYNTIVIEHFNMAYGMRNGYDNYNASTASIVEGGCIKFNTTTVGFMIPAYDYMGDNDGNAGNYEWYYFEKGQKYSVALEMTNVTTANKANHISVTAATGAGSGGKRSTANQGNITTVNANTSSADLEVGATFTCNFADGYNNAIIRGTAENVSLTANIQKIIITKVSNEPVAKLVAVSKRDASATKTAGVRFKGRISGAAIENATEAGFVVVPTDVLSGKTVAAYMNKGGIPAAKCVNYNAADGSNLIYGGYTSNYSADSVAAFYDYQVVLTGLTSLSDETLDLRGFDFTVAFYTVTAEGTVYHDEYTTSYNTIAGMK